MSTHMNIRLFFASLLVSWVAVHHPYYYNVQLRSIQHILLIAFLTKQYAIPFNPKCLKPYMLQIKQFICCVVAHATFAKLQILRNYFRYFFTNLDSFPATLLEDDGKMLLCVINLKPACRQTQRSVTLYVTNTRHCKRQLSQNIRLILKNQP